MPEAVIGPFTGRYRFLSNFYYVQIEWGGVTWLSAEHLYQARKTDVLLDQTRIREARTPSQAKRYGGVVKLIPNWETERLLVMRNVVSMKFEQNPDLLKELGATSPQHLVEFNNWGDTFWGTTFDGVGDNWLGRILMDVRDDLCQ